MFMHFWLCMSSACAVFHCSELFWLSHRCPLFQFCLLVPVHSSTFCLGLLSEGEARPCSPRVCLDMCERLVVCVSATHLHCHIPCPQDACAVSFCSTALFFFYRFAFVSLVPTTHTHTHEYCPCPC